MMSGKSEIQLYYFHARARAEPIRMSLKMAGIAFEDIRITHEEWLAKKAETPYGQVPYLVYKGTTYGESRAIASFVARLCDLAGKSPEDSMRVDEVYSLTGNLLEEMAWATFEKDAAKKGAMQAKLASETIPRYLGYFERLLTEAGGTGYFVANQLSQADLTVYDITHSLLKEQPAILKDRPQIRKMRDTVEAIPKVKAYLASREEGHLGF